MPQTGKIRIIHVALRHSIFGKFLGKERSVYSLFFSETRMVDTFAGILYFPKNFMIFPKTAIFGNFFDFWGVFGAFLGNFWELLNGAIFLLQCTLTISYEIKSKFWGLTNEERDNALSLLYLCISSIVISPISQNLSVYPPLYFNSTVALPI